MISRRHRHRRLGYTNLSEESALEDTLLEIRKSKKQFFSRRRQRMPRLWSQFTQYLTTRIWRKEDSEADDTQAGAAKTDIDNRDADNVEPKPETTKERKDCNDSKSIKSDSYMADTEDSCLSDDDYQSEEEDDDEECFDNHSISSEAECDDYFDTDGRRPHRQNAQTIYQEEIEDIEPCEDDFFLPTRKSAAELNKTFDNIIQQNSLQRTLEEVEEDDISQNLAENTVRHKMRRKSLSYEDLLDIIHGQSRTLIEEDSTATETEFYNQDEKCAGRIQGSSGSDIRETDCRNTPWVRYREDYGREERSQDQYKEQYREQGRDDILSDHQLPFQVRKSKVGTASNGIQDQLQYGRYRRPLHNRIMNLKLRQSWAGDLQTLHEVESASPDKGEEVSRYVPSSSSKTSIDAEPKSFERSSLESYFFNL